MSREEVESVGYDYGDWRELSQRYQPERLTSGWNQLDDGERIFYVANPALGLWAVSSRLQDGCDVG